MFKNNKSQKNSFELKNYVKISDKYYKFNHELNNIYYCPDNIVITNGIAKQWDKSQYRIIDYFIIDKKNKTLQVIDENIKDSFVDIHKNFNKITEIDNKIIIDDDIVIVLNNNNIIEYKNPLVTSIGDDFLRYNKELKNIELPLVTSIGNYFLYNNKELKNKFIK